VLEKIKQEDYYMNLKLVFPTEEQEAMWRDIVVEFEKEDEKIIPYALSFGLHDFSMFLQKTLDFHNSKNLADFVPGTTYFLMDEKEDKIFGAVNIRHSLNQDLLFRGGHIGYGIRPSQRRKGYATKMLNLALEQCRELGLKKVLVTCDKENIGSAKTITNNGGILENEVIERSGNIVQRYWIILHIGTQTE